MRMRPIFSTSRNQSDAKKADDDSWQEQFFKLDVKYIVSQQVSRSVSGWWMPRSAAAHVAFPSRGRSSGVPWCYAEYQTPRVHPVIPSHHRRERVYLPNNKRLPILTAIFQVSRSRMSPFWIFIGAKDDGGGEW